jgi:hypothetical protein
VVPSLFIHLLQRSILSVIWLFCNFIGLKLTTFLFFTSSEITVRKFYTTSKWYFQKLPTIKNPKIIKMSPNQQFCIYIRFKKLVSAAVLLFTFFQKTQTTWNHSRYSSGTCTFYHSFCVCCENT